MPDVDCLDLSGQYWNCGGPVLQDSMAWGDLYEREDLVSGESQLADRTF